MKKARGSKSRYLQYAAVVLLVVFLLSGVLLFVNLWEKYNSGDNFDDVDSTTFVYNGEEYVLKDGIETVLVLGLDKFEGSTDETADRNDKQSDFMMLLVIDNNNRKWTGIHINRDTMAQMNKLDLFGQPTKDKITQQIALAHTYGNGKETSCRNAADAVSELLLGIKVDHYISVTMDAVPVFNDLVGGVEVEVLDDFTGIDDTLVKGETVTLMGDHALNYVRERYGLEDSSNESRMIRQRQYIRALYEKTLEMDSSDEEFIIDASKKMSEYMVSNYSLTRLQELFQKVSDYRFTEIRYLEGESTLGEDAAGIQHIEFTPYEDSIKKVVAELFYSLKD